MILTNPFSSPPSHSFFLLSRLPNIPKPNMKICILADQFHLDQAKAMGIDFMSVEDLKKLNKNKKLIKKLGMYYIYYYIALD